MRILPAEDGWRVRVDCAGACGATCVVTVEHALRGTARCIDCGRAYRGAAVPRRPAPGETRRNGLGMGQPGAAMPGRLDPHRLTRAADAKPPAPPAPYLDEGEVDTSHPAVPARAVGMRARALAAGARCSLRLTRTAGPHLVLRMRGGRVRGWFGWDDGASSGGQFMRGDGSIAGVNLTQANAYLDGGTLSPRRVVEPAPPARPSDPQALYAATMVRYGPRGVWFASGTALAEVYPCRCYEGRDRWACEHERCPCWGRTDVHIKAGCCAWGYLARLALWQKMIAEGSY